MKKRTDVEKIKILEKPKRNTISLGPTETKFRLRQKKILNSEKFINVNKLQLSEK